MVESLAGPVYPPGMFELDLEISPRLKGRAAVKPTLGRELTQADVVALSVERGTPAPDVVRITDRHHALARALASGMSEGEAAFSVGISPSRVSILKASPAFIELLEFYRRDVQAIYSDMHDRLKGIAMDSARILADRLEDDPDSLSTGQLMELVKMGADRTGYGPQSSSVQTNIVVGAASRLDEARKRVQERKTIDITPMESEDDQRE